MAVTFSRLIQGCMTWGIWGNNLDEKDMVALMHHDLEQGITTFDHADIYGDYSTEEAFGNAFAKANIARDHIQLISKCGIQYTGQGRPQNRIKHYQYDADYIICSTERSLRLLQTDYLDLLLLHRPSPLMHPDEIQKALEKLTNQGKIGAFGVSNFTPSQQELVAIKSTISANQIECSLTTNQAMFDGSLDAMITNKIMPMAWSPLGNYFKEKGEQHDRIAAVMQELTEKYSASEDQLLLAWLLKHPAGIHPVIGTTKATRITAAVAAQDIDLEIQDWFALLVASQGHKVP